MPHLARPRHCLKVPEFRARAGVVSASVPRRSSLPLARAGPNHHHVLENRRNAVVGHHHVHCALFAEPRIELARARIQSDQAGAGGEHNASRILPVTRPKRHAARRSPLGFIAPNLFPRLRLQSHHPALRGNIHHAIYNQRSELGHPARSGKAKRGRLQAIRPSLSQLTHIRGSDLIERRKSSARKVNSDSNIGQSPGLV